MLLTSSRANPNAPVDLFSDYDVILVVTDIHPFLEDESWLGDFGDALVVYRDPVRREYGLERFARITQYEDGTKIDFTVWPVGILGRVVEEAHLPDELEVGYGVLLDKDGLAARLRPPTCRAFIPAPPSEAVFREVVEEFFHETTYVAKNLWREELLPAKYSLELMKFDVLRRMLEWHMEGDHGWAVNTGVYGRGLQKRLKADIWAQLESTFVGAGMEENWEALFETIDLFRRVAREVADHLGYAYPHDLDRRVLEYLQRVRSLERGEEDFFE